MSRSLKKGPFVEKKLFDRIEAMNEKNEKKVLKTWSRASGTGLFHQCTEQIHGNRKLHRVSE